MKITDEMVEMASKASVNVYYDWNLLDGLAKDMRRGSMRAALEAVAPMIARAENEACAEVVKDQIDLLGIATPHDLISAIRARHATTPSPTQSQSPDPAQ